MDMKPTTFDLRDLTVLRFKWMGRLLRSPDKLLTIGDTTFRVTSLGNPIPEDMNSSSQSATSRHWLNAIMECGSDAYDSEDDDSDMEMVCENCGGVWDGHSQCMCTC